MKRIGLLVAAVFLAYFGFLSSVGAFVVLLPGGDSSGSGPMPNSGGGAPPGVTFSGSEEQLITELIAHHGLPYASVGQAYIKAAREAPCPLEYRTLYGVGATESGHGTSFGATVDEARGVVTSRIVSSAGAEGLTQFMPDTWADYSGRFDVDGNGDGIEDKHNIWDATKATATKLCADNIDENWEEAIGSYNGGGGWRGKSESLNYVTKVREHMEAIPALPAANGAAPAPAVPVPSPAPAPVTSATPWKWAWPCDGNPPGDGGDFGLRDIGIGRNFHPGIDIGCSTGDPVGAVRAGTVVYSDMGYNGGFGGSVHIDHGDGYLSRYHHLSASHVQVGQIVGQMDHIADAGSTGVSSGPHLHLEVWEAWHGDGTGYEIDPMPLLEGQGQAQVNASGPTAPGATSPTILPTRDTMTLSRPVTMVPPPSATMRPPPQTTMRPLPPAARPQPGVAPTTPTGVPQLSSANQLTCPVGGPVGTEHRKDFGDPRGGGTRTHQGNDVWAFEGTPIVAPFAGVVTEVVNDPSLNAGGRMIFLRAVGGPFDGTVAVMMHNQVNLVIAGMTVAQGQQVGTVGDTGNAEGGPAHIHFELRPGGGTSIDPWTFTGPACANNRVGTGALG